MATGAKYECEIRFKMSHNEEDDSMPENDETPSNEKKKITLVDATSILKAEAIRQYGKSIDYDFDGNEQESVNIKDGEEPGSVVEKTEKEPEHFEHSRDAEGHFQSLEIDKKGQLSNSKTVESLGENVEGEQANMSQFSSENDREKQKSSNEAESDRLKMEVDDVKLEEEKTDTSFVEKNSEPLIEGHEKSSSNSMGSPGLNTKHGGVNDDNMATEQGVINNTKESVDVVVSKGDGKKTNGKDVKDESEESIERRAAEVENGNGAQSHENKGEEEGKSWFCL